MWVARPGELQSQVLREVGPVRAAGEALVGVGGDRQGPGWSGHQAGGAGKSLQQLELRGIDVLEPVHQQVPGHPPAPNILVPLQRPDRPDQQVVQGQGVLPSLLRVVKVSNVPPAALPRRNLRGIGPPGLVQGVPAQGRQEVPPAEPAGQVQRLQRPSLVPDGVVGREAQGPGPAAAEDVVGVLVEGVHPDGLPSGLRVHLQAAAQVRRARLRGGQADNAVRGGSPPQQACHPGDHRVGPARASAAHHHHDVRLVLGSGPFHGV